MISNLSSLLNVFVRDFVEESLTKQGSVSVDVI
jgi:hypothetical protein